MKLPCSPKTNKNYNNSQEHGSSIKQLKYIIKL